MCRASRFSTAAGWPGVVVRATTFAIITPTICAAGPRFTRTSWNTKVAPWPPSTRVTAVEMARRWQRAAKQHMARGETEAAQALLAAGDALALNAPRRCCDWPAAICVRQDEVIPRAADNEALA